MSLDGRGLGSGRGYGRSDQQGRPAVKERQPFLVTRSYQSLVGAWTLRRNAEHSGATNRSSTKPLAPENVSPNAHVERQISYPTGLNDVDEIQY